MSKAFKMTEQEVVFAPEDREDIEKALKKLGIRGSGEIIGLLAAAATKYRKCAIGEMKSPTIAAVRAALRQLADHLRQGNEISQSIMSDAWLALLGRYPASIADLVPCRAKKLADANSFKSESSTDLKSESSTDLKSESSTDLKSESSTAFKAESSASESECSMAFPIENPASIHIIRGLWAQPGMGTLARIRYWRHENHGVVGELFRVLAIDIHALPGDLALAETDCALLAHRATSFSETQRQQLAAIAEWAAGRVETTCIPRNNPGRRTVERWAKSGPPEHRVIGDVLEALWPQDVPTLIEFAELATIVDTVIYAGRPPNNATPAAGRRPKPEASENKASNSCIRSAVSLKRELVKVRQSLPPLFARMTQLTNANVDLHARRCVLKRGDCRSKDRYRRKHAMLAYEAAGIAIRKNITALDEIDAQYCALTGSVKEIERRLQCGDFNSRQGRRITGPPAPELKQRRAIFSNARA